LKKVEIASFRLGFPPALTGNPVLSDKKKIKKMVEVLINVSNLLFIDI